MTKEEIAVINVKILKKTNVKPQKPLGKKECQLVTFDLPYLAFYYNQKLMIYKGAENFEETVEKLKDGLALVLEDFYQLAGRLGKDEEGVFKVEYDDDMDGVEVIVAAADGIEVAHLTNEEGTTKFLDLIPYNKILNLEGLHRPLLAMQLTKLEDGLSMGLAFNHAVLDGTSTWHFMTSWAELSCGATTISLNLSEPSKSETNSHMDLPFRERVFKFSESAIDQIKSKVNANLPEGSLTRFSTFQSFSAHIWLAITRARQLKKEDYTVYIVFADCRKRVEPPMPESYFGNLIKAIFTVTVGELLLANPIEFTAGMIQQAIVKHDAKAIEERNKEWESSPKFFSTKMPGFKVYDVDFGWGKPEIVRSGLNNRFDGMVYLYPERNGGRGIDMDICLEANAMERLEKDKEFLVEA
ncbi:unnamed protein product [Withania somnifera]